MKLLLLTIGIVLLSAGPVSAQSEAICLFSDQAGTQCDIVDSGSLVQVHFYHQFSPGTTGSQWRIDLNGLPWTHLGDMWSYPTVIGTSIAGVSIGYGSCLTSPVHIGTANFFGSAAPAGAMIQIVADPAAGYIKGVDCNYNSVGLAGGQAYVNSSLPCVCESVPDPTPLLYVHPLTVDLGETATTAYFYIANAGGATLDWTVNESVPWLELSPTAGTGGGTVTVTVDRGGVPTGQHSALVAVASNGGNEVVTVEMAVPAPEPILIVSPPSLDFGENGENLILHVVNGGTNTLTWNIQSDQPWLTAVPPSGYDDTDVVVFVDRAGLAPGPYNGNLHVTSNGGDLWVPVSMEVPAPDPILLVSPMSLSFGSSDTHLTLNIYNQGTGELNWNITSDQAWLSAAPAFGTNGGMVTATVDRTGLPDGPYYGNLYITSAGGDATVPVDMWVGGVPLLFVDPVTLVYAPDDTTSGFTITNAGGGTLEWSLSDDKTWIEIVPPLSGTGDAVVTVNVDPALVPAGPVQTGYVTVSSNVGDASVEIRFVRQTGFSAGSIAVYSDAGGYDCNFVDAGGLVQVHFFHMYTDGATASQWKLDIGGIPWIHLGDVLNYATSIGTTINGISIGYGQCLASPIYLAVANFFGSNAPACSLIRIVADPSALSGQIEGVDCALTKTYPTGGSGRVNPDPTCFCGLIPVQHTTWGAIKAMYQGD